MTSRDENTLGDRLTLLALCTAVAFCSAVTVLVVERYGMISIGVEPAMTSPLEVTISSAHPKGDLELPRPPAPRPAKQFAYVAYREIPRLFPSLAEEFEAAEMAAVAEAQSEAAQQSTQENPQWWSAEVHRDAVKADGGPRVAAPARPVTDSGLPWRRSVVRGPHVGDKRLTERLAEISPAAKRRLAERFTAANAQWPPDDIALVAIKDEKSLELHARAEGKPWKLIHRYPVMAASGTSGPKLRQGDMQVPEGVYGISFLNPDSRFHVSLRVNYPNAFDRQMAAKDGRTNLGGDIMIHGKNVSKGCLAIGDAAAEEIFVLAAQIGLPNVKVVIAPTDFRSRGVPDAEPGQPQWLKGLYTEVASELSHFERPPSMSLLSFFGK